MFINKYANVFYTSWIFDQENKALNNAKNVLFFGSRISRLKNLGEINHVSNK